MLVPAAVQSEQGRCLLGAVTGPRGCSASVQPEVQVHVCAWIQAHAREGIANRLLRASGQGAVLLSGMAQLRPQCLGPTKAPRPDPGRQRETIPKAPGRITAYCSPVRSRLSLAVRDAAGDVASVAALRDRCPAWSHTWIRFAKPRPDSTRIQGLAWRPSWRDLGTRCMYCLPSSTRATRVKQEDAWFGSVQVCSSLFDPASPAST